jgi:sensor histidine kinase YesM
MPATDPPRGGKQTLYPALVSRAIWFVIGIAVLVVSSALIVTLLLVTTHHTRLSQTGIEFLVSGIYAAVIAPPSAIVLNWVGHRYTERFPRAIFLILAFAQTTTAVVGCLAAGLVLVFAGIIVRNTYWSEFSTTVPFAILISLMIGLTMATYETLRFKLQAATLELRTHQMEQERANKLLVEARLSSLESRIHPHFLFNTLNSIAALIPSDPARAEATVSKLASLLRFSLNANHNSLVPLAQELKVVRDYLEIESTRFGPRLRYEITVPESLGLVKVPPLALQSLVENSVKHVAAQRSEGATIQIAGLRANGRMQLDVTDDGPGFSLGSISPEHGLGNFPRGCNCCLTMPGSLT